MFGGVRVRAEQVRASARVVRGSIVRGAVRGQRGQRCGGGGAHQSVKSMPVRRWTGDRALTTSQQQRW